MTISFIYQEFPWNSVYPHPYRLQAGHPFSSSGKVAVLIFIHPQLVE